MKYSSKAISSSLIILFFFSFAISLLLYGVFNVTYSDRHDFCKDITLTPTLNCETRTEDIRITLNNRGGSKTAYFEINSELDSTKHLILAETSEQMEFEKDTSYKIIPHVKGDDGKLYACVAQTQYLSTLGVQECQ